MRKRKTIEGLFKGRAFERGIITLYVRWYLRYMLSYRDLVECLCCKLVDVLLAEQLQ